MLTNLPQLCVHDVTSENSPDGPQCRSATQGHHCGLPEGPGCLCTTVYLFIQKLLMSRSMFGVYMSLATIHGQHLLTVSQFLGNIVHISDGYEVGRLGGIFTCSPFSFLLQSSPRAVAGSGLCGEHPLADEGAAPLPLQLSGGPALPHYLWHLPCCRPVPSSLHPSLSLPVSAFLFWSPPQCSLHLCWLSVFEYVCIGRGVLGVVLYTAQRWHCMPLAVRLGAA